MDKQSTASEFQGMLEARGVSRRSFMKLCGTLAVMTKLVVDMSMVIRT